jgi:type IV secretory pathway TraG/TraD family ATPase VirD4
MILTSKIQIAAMKRQKMTASERKDFFLYVDEFQNFVTDSIESILSEARKYRLGLVLAHQYL